MSTAGDECAEAAAQSAPAGVVMIVAVVCEMSPSCNPFTRWSSLDSTCLWASWPKEAGCEHRPEPYRRMAVRCVVGRVDQGIQQRQGEVAAAAWSRAV